MKSFKDWFISQESSPATRSVAAAYWGTGPKTASPFSHSTPNPGMVDKLLKDIDDTGDSDDDDDDKKNKKKKKKKEKVDENKGKAPDYSFDAFVRKAKSAKDETDKEIADAEEKSLEMDRDFDKKEKDRTIKIDQDKDTKDDTKKKEEEKDVKKIKKEGEKSDQKSPKYPIKDKKLDRRPKINS